MAQANQQPDQHLPHGNVVSMPDAFDPKDLLNLKTSFNPLNINEPVTNKKPARLDFNLDFLNHPARNMLHFSQNHLFKILARFCHTMAGIKSSHVIYLLV